MLRNTTVIIACFFLISRLTAQISTFPNYTSFETEALCGTTCTGSCSPVGAWRNADQWGFTQAGTDWLVEDGATPSTTTGPDVDHTMGSATGHYMYVETSGCNNVTGFLVSDIYNFSALTAPTIEFWYHMYGATMGTMNLDVDTTGLGNWVLNVVPSWTDNVNTWQMRTISLAAYAGRPSVRLRIRAQTGTSFTSDMAVDDITVFEPAPYDIDLFMVSAGGGCGNSATTPVEITMYNAGSDTILAGTSIPVAFEINLVTVWDTILTSMNYLSGDTFTYTFVNGFADLSGPTAVNITAWQDWALDVSSGNDTANTSAYGIPIISTYPYFEDFESGQNGWTIYNGVAGTWDFGTPTKLVINSAGSGVNSFVTGGLTGTYLDNDNSWVEGPCFDFSTICDPVISLKVWWNAEFSWDGMNVTISTDGGSTWNLVGAFGDPFTWYNDNTIVGNPGGSQSGWSGRNSTSNGSGGWVTARHRLVGAGGFSNVKIRINFGTDGSVVDDGTAFDDIHIFNGTDFGADQTICNPATVTLNADHGNVAATYAWSTGATTASILAGTTGTYTVTITASGTCTVTESIYVLAIDSTTSLNLGADSTLCGSNLLLDAGNWPGCTFLWSTGDSTQSIVATTSGIYVADITSPCGNFSDSIVVTLSPNPVVDLGPDSTYCDMVTLDAGAGNTSYLWSTSDSTQTITVTSSGTYEAVVTNGSGCSASDTVNIVVNAAPVVALGADEVICDGGQLTLDAGNPGDNYLWSNGSTNQTLVVSTAGTYSVTVTDSSGCSGNDNITVTTAVTPVAAFTSSVTGGLTYNFTDQSTGGATIWSWTFGDTGTSSSQNPSHTYANDGSYTVTLIVSNDCGSDTTTTTITATGFSDGTNAFPVTVFPNPGDGNFNLRFNANGTAVKITVANLTGQIVYSRDLGERSGLVAESFQVNDQPAGIYFMHLTVGDQHAVVKLIVE